MAAPELRLNVSLDLDFFRQQLQKLTVVAQSEFTPKLNVKFNRSTLDTELNNLQAAIKRRDYRLNINDTAIKSARLNAQKLKNTLDLLTGTKYNIDIGIKESASKQMDDLQSLFSKGKTGQAFGGGAAAVSRARAGAAREGLLGRIGAGSMGKSLGEGGYNIPGLQRVIQELGGTPSKGRSNLVAQAKQLVNSVDDALIDRVYASVKDLRMSMKPLRGQGRISAARSAPNINAILDPIAGLTENPRAARRMLRMLPENRISTDILGKASAQAAFYEQVPSARETQRNIKGFDPLLKAIANSFADYAKSLSTTDPWVGKIGTGIADIVSKASTSAQAQKLLPAAGQSSAERMARQRFAGLPPIEAPTIGMEQAPLSRGASYTLNKARRLLGMPIGPVSSYTPNPWAGSASVPPAATTAPSRLLPPAGATSNYGVAAQAQAMAQATQQYGFMHAPSVPPSMARSSSGTPPGGPPGGGGGRGAGFFGGMQFNMPDLPGAAIVRELGQEFGFAAKQVLLFGSAYKALAFIQTFPAQVGEAVGALQSFRNTMGEISPTAQEAGASSQFILDIVEKYNVPLQSARDGFVKLYASMQPAGFSGDEIRDLFLGISQTAATFGMSADKVDRVNYAFAQMASKGQVMSEELKGQLGDVLPGAMALFAEAAGFEGPAAITKFSEALEDGAYKGGAMKTLLTNVGIVMRKEFGPGAEGAARTFQGVMNRMQNSTKLLYESFEPVAVGFLNAVVMPMTNGIKTITDGFNAFFTGTAAKTSGGFAFAQELEKLRPSFEGIAQNVKELLPLLQTFGSVLLNVGKFFALIAGNPITGFLLKLYGNILLVNTVFNLLGGRILVNLITSLGASISRFIALNIAMASMQRTSAVTNSTLAGTQLQMALLTRNASAAIGPVSLLKNALIGLARIGLIAIAINVVINGMAEIDRLKKSLADIGTFSSAKYRKEISAMSKEDVNSRLITNRATQKQIKEELKQYQGMGGNARGLVTGRDEELRANLLMVQVKEQELIRANRSARTQVQLSSSVTGTGLAPITGVAGEEDGNASRKKGAKDKKERESQIPQLTLQLEKTRELSGIEMQIVNAQLMNNDSQLNSLELVKKLVEFKYEAKGLALEDLTAEERSLKMKEIGLRREQVILESQLQLQINLNKERVEIQKDFETMLEGYQEEADFQQRYLDLINQGILPSMAKARVEGEKAFAQAEKRLDNSMEQIEANIAVLEVTIEALKLEGKLTEEKQKQLEAAENNLKTFKEELRLRGLLKDTGPERKDAAIAAAGKTLAPKTAQEYIGEGLEEAQKNLERLMNTGYQVVEAANAIGDAFGTAFKGILTGSMTAQEAFAGMFQSIADHFADMVAKMIAEWLKAQLIQGFMNIIGAAIPGASTGFGSGFDKFGGKNFGTGPDVTKFFGADGGMASGGWQPFPITAFANGGMVSGPTLGLVGEGRYNEAIIPLPDGKSVPVQLAGGAGGNAAPISTNIVVNVKNGQAESQMSGNQGNQLARELEGAVRQVILKEIRPGGLISSSR